MKKRYLCLLLAVLMLFSATVLPVPAQGASSMSVSEDMISVLKVMEGFSARVYWDYAQWTVGYGTKCPDDKVEYYKNNDITEAYALELLAQAVDRFEADVNRFIDRHGLTLNQHQFDALVSFSYNCGSGWMSETTGYFNTAVREGGSASELIYGMCLYSTAGGEYILTGRRLCEANMYLNGVYKAYNADSQGNPDNLKYIFLDGNGGKVRYTICGYDANEETPISVAFSSIPTGVGEDGQPFVYTFAGWHTALGAEVEKLDGSLADGEVLYARWKDPKGAFVTLPKGVKKELTVTVTNSSVNVRSGPATFYDQVGSYTENETVPIVEIYETGGYTWGRSELGWFRLDFTDFDSINSQFPKTGTITGDGVNYRTAPVFEDNKVGQLYKGDRVTVVEERDSAGMRWGKFQLNDNEYWVSLDYVLYDADVKKVTGITLLQQPTKRDYVQKSESLKLEGSVLQVTYEGGSTTAMTLTRAMVTQYDNENLGETTVQAAYEGYSVSFPVNIIKATVTFRNWDGTELSTAQYAYGEEVKIPPIPKKPFDGTYYYVFNGWDKTVSPCAGNTTYTATYVQSQEPDEVIAPEKITSEIYTVTDTLIRKIPVGTTVETLVKGIQENAYITVYQGDTPVTETTEVKTGMVVKLVFRTQVIQSVTVVVTGDVSGDGGITITDMLNVKSHILGKANLTEVAAQAADTNGDGAVSITDFIQIKGEILGKSQITPN